MCCDWSVCRDWSGAGLPGKCWFVMVPNAGEPVRELLSGTSPSPRRPKSPPMNVPIRGDGCMDERHEGEAEAVLNPSPRCERGEPLREIFGVGIDESVKIMIK